MNGDDTTTGRRKGPSSRWGILTLALLLAGSTGVSLLSLKWRSTLRVQHIAVEGANAVSAKDIAAMTKIPCGGTSILPSMSSYWVHGALVPAAV